VRRKLELDAQIRELAICTVAKITGAKYEWYQHAPEYLAAGGAQAKLDLLENPEAASRHAGLTDREQAAVQLAAEMTRSVQVADATLARARTLFGERQLVELVGTIATYNMVARFLEALGIDERGE
jgi:alkylhydroperoxidase family enzyme